MDGSESRERERHLENVKRAAVEQDGEALQYAAEECKAEREKVLVAVQEDPHAIWYASEELLLDSTFAPEAKQCYYILK
eukprot:4747430-Amphidinium_carterae.1